MYKYFVLVVVFLFLVPQPVHAYIDPGTGSYLFQFVIAGVLGGTYFMRSYIVQIKDKLLKKKAAPKTNDEKPNKTSKAKSK